MFRMRDPRGLLRPSLSFFHFSHLLFARPADGMQHTRWRHHVDGAGVICWKTWVGKREKVVLAIWGGSLAAFFERSDHRHFCPATSNKNSVACTQPFAPWLCTGATFSTWWLFVSDVAKGARPSPSTLQALWISWRNVLQRVNRKQKEAVFVVH